MANKWLPPWGERSGDVEHFRGFKNQVDSLFEDWFGRSMGGVLAPRLDVAEDEKAVTITAELPGVKENEIEVSLVGDRLTLKGREAIRPRRQRGSARPRYSPHRTLLRRVPADDHPPLPGRGRSSLGSVQGWRSDNHATETT
jgi:HSP20 family protein